MYYKERERKREGVGNVISVGGRGVTCLSVYLNDWNKMHLKIKQ